MAYSSDIREAALRKLSAHYRPTLNSVAREFGINPGTLRLWRDSGRRKQVGEMGNKAQRQQDWSLEKRFQALIETGHMNDDELGAYCRRHGIHANTLALWRENCMNAMRKNVALENELAETKAENRGLKRDARRKDKALAEASARLILQKKSEELWGMKAEDEDDI